MHSTVFEYGYIACKDDAPQLESQIRAVLISARAFRYLKGVCLSAEPSNLSRCLSLSKRYGVELIQVKNYVGVVFTPTGEHIEILPKIGRKAANQEEAEARSRDTLLLMLQHLGSFRHISANQASVANKRMPLLEVFIQQFLQSVNRLIKRGLKSDYLSQQDNLSVQKGKLLVAQQLRHNIVNKHKFYVEFDKYMLNRPANRLIATALQKVGSYTKLPSNQKLLRELKFAFVDVPTSKSVSHDIAALKLDRGMHDYHGPLEWVKLILAGFSPLSMKGDTNSLSLLFPMESVFESYVASVLRSQLEGRAALQTQAQSKYLVRHEKQRKFQLKPDLLIKPNLGGDIVLDTKWKLLDLNEHNYGVSQSDLYQMFAYGHKYLGGKGDLYLIYPSHDGFKSALPSAFEFNDLGSESLRLWIVPFATALDGTSRLVVNQQHGINRLMNSLS
nr:McrC family protein [uncultured Ferrimonas sp.]